MTVRNNEATMTLDLLANDFNLYSVSFRYSENVWCSNIVLADSTEQAERYYSEYKDIIVNHISKASAKYEVERKNKPLVIA